ncbi:hypothetical protein [Actinacidiphila rubida]|uniref:Uncharacterized protein n=1 Tax=Actinacidiphila rubida TaxID=310780 RepID=A0A1H8GSK4_9ACTN|nr:hypothetical protein [Actinacidiphila rubida]SEN46825.1 hypothetical protein SAMN05216267_1005256 [Actinacidiphila rubida]
MSTRQEHGQADEAGPERHQELPSRPEHPRERDGHGGHATHDGDDGHGGHDRHDRHDRHDGHDGHGGHSRTVDGRPEPHRPEPGAPADAVAPASSGSAAAEDLLRAALLDAATGIRPSAWPVRAVLERARRRRRARRLAFAVCVVAAVAVAGGGVVVARNRTAASPVAPAAAPTAPATTARPTPPHSSVKVTIQPSAEVVRPGEVVELDTDTRLRLDATRRCLSFGHGPWECKSVADGNQAANSVSLQSAGSAGVTVYTPLYIGSGTAASMTVTAGGTTVVLKVVTLPGRPGYATGYGTGPSPDGGGPGSAAGRSPLADVKVTVYDAKGLVLASLP